MVIEGWLIYICVCFFRKKTAYDMRISDWSSDVCSSDLQRFAEAARLMAGCRRGPMRPARIMLAVYRRLLDRLQQRGWENPGDDIRLPKVEKLWIALRNGL